MTLNYTALRETIEMQSNMAHAKNHDTSFEYQLELEALETDNYTVETIQNETWIRLPWGRLFAVQGKGKKAVLQAVERTIEDHCIIIDDLKKEDATIDVKFSRLQHYIELVDTLTHDSDSTTAFCLQKAVRDIMKEAIR